MKTISKSISVSPNLHKYLLDHKDSNKRSIEAVIFGLIGELDEFKRTSIKVKDEDVVEVFELLCDIPFEKATMLDSEPSTKRHPAIEAILTQLRERIDDNDEEK